MHDTLLLMQKFKPHSYSVTPGYICTKAGIYRLYKLIFSDCINGSLLQESESDDDMDDAEDEKVRLSWKSNFLLLNRS